MIGFPREADMLDPVERTLTERFSDVDSLWILLREQVLHTRVPDTMLGRLNIDALQRRADLAVLRALTDSEVRALRALAPRRPSNVGVVAHQMRVTEATARRVLRRLSSDGFVVGTPRGGFVRRVPTAPVVTRLVSVEVKRSDALQALSQARQHVPYVAKSFVAFDSAYETRFLRRRNDFFRAGIGLMSVDAGVGTAAVVGQPGAGLRSPLGMAIAAERMLEGLLRETPRSLPESRLPGAVVGNQHQPRPRLFGLRSTQAQQLLPGL